MNIKKIFLLIFTILMTFSISNVFAYNSNVSDNLYLNSNSNYMYFGWTSENNYSASQTMAWFSESQNLNEPYQRAYKYITPGSGNINDANGFSIVFPNEQQFIANNNYNGAFVICSYGGSLPLTDLNISVGDRVAIIEPSYYSTIYKYDSIDTGLVDDGQGSYFDQCKLVTFSFKAKNSGNYFAFRYRTSTNTSMGNYIAFLGSNFDYNGTDYSSYFNSLNGSINSLNSSLNNNTQNVINNDNQNTQNIINNNNQNTQNLIDNQNEITKGNCTTEPSINKFHFNNNTFTQNNYNVNVNNGVITINGGNSQDSNSYYIKLDFITPISISSGENYVYSINNTGTNWNGAVYICKEIGNCPYNMLLRTENSSSINVFQTGTYNFLYIYLKGTVSNLVIKPQLELGNTKTDFSPYEEKEVCTGGTWGKLDEAENTRKGIFGKIKDLFNFFTNNDDPDLNEINNFGGLLPTQPVDSVLNLPIILFQTILSYTNGTCEPLNATLPFINYTISLPCVFDLFYNMGIAPFIITLSIPLLVLIGYRYLVFTYKRLDAIYNLDHKKQVNDWGGV